MSDLLVCREDLASERARFDEAAFAPSESRVANVGEWMAAQDMRRRRILLLEHRLAELVALEESAAELRERFDPGYAA